VNDLLVVYLDSIDKRLLDDSTRMTGCTAPLFPSLLHQEKRCFGVTPHGKPPAAASREAPILVPVASRPAVSLRHFERRGAAGEADRNEDLLKQCSDSSVIDRSAGRCRPCWREVVFGGPLSACPFFLLRGR
jgi:hypothetical protein